MKPEIGVTLATPRAGTTRDVIVASGARYLQAVEDACGRPLPIVGPKPPDDEAAGALVARLDGLVLSGGGDIHPRFLSKGVGEAYVDGPEGWPDTDEDRDQLEFLLLRHFLPTGRPVLGVCRGFQVLNVALGGGLIPDLPLREHNTRADTTSGFHTVEILPQTRLSRALGFHGSLQVNSRHHQGVSRELLAPGLRLSATSDLGDQIVEGFEDPGDRWLVAVQWHPERVLDFTENERAPNQRLFGDFLEAARAGMKR